VPLPTPQLTDPIVNSTLERILNDVIRPQPEDQQSRPQKNRQPKATTTPTQQPKATTTATTTTKTATSTATTSPKSTTTPGIFQRIISDGDSNQFSASSYYVPLDNLGTQATYGLSAIAMILGIAGGTLIIGQPEKRKPLGTAWARQLRREPLLEP
jgi:hypothetical protein